MDERFKTHFPNLSDVAKKKTSESNPNYNCIAWAFKDNRRFWWPDRRAYWPMDITGLNQLVAFERLFAAQGWEKTNDSNVEPNYEKVALFALNGIPTHAARLLENGYWTSKLGVEIDISHGLRELDGPAYGTILQIYRKAIS
tara:strand:+ start:1231 stop:1656 length:426 start_codon:yes stop_codon:yes gene_type:complete